ncbi:MAG: HK97 gp10 family phage protein [Eubacterium coprostanoligenes]|nr:HK97 gp10 family phage protein [Eubacterium coprostanoligenes]
MPKVSMKLPDDLIKKISSLGDKTDEICEKALKAGADVVEQHLKTNLNNAIGKNLKYESRSTGQLKRSIGVTPVLIDKNGNYNIKIGVDDRRTDSVTNTMLANILEYGKVGQPPKPFLKPTKSKSKKPALDAITHTLEDEISKL